jgi:2',3'-cyclic-nucleotide 2'-phosphodiesterase (5'-nucleotidase family)
MTNAYEGVADIEAMNAVGYEIAELGNNEFKAKDAREQGDAAGAQAALLKVVKRSRFAWICANATDSQGSFLTGVQPYVVREIAGVRVGFLGLTAPRSAAYPQTKGWHILDPITTAKEWIPKARQDCDVLIAMTHIGVELDLPLAMKTKGIDAIVGGDSHTFLYKAWEAKNLDGVKVPIVQDGEFGANLGRFDLHFELGSDHAYHLKGYTYSLIPVGADTPEAPDVVAKIDPYVKPLREVVGHSLVGSTPAERLKITATTIAEAIRYESKAAVGLCQTNDLFEVFRKPDVTKYDIWAAMPFKNNVVVAKVDGTKLRDILATKGIAFSGVASVDQVDVTATYDVAMTDFQAAAFKVPAVDTHLDAREALVTYFNRK